MVCVFCIRNKNAKYADFLMVNPMPKITLLSKWYKGKHLQISVINIVACYKKRYTNYMVQQ